MIRMVIIVLSRKRCFIDSKINVALFRMFLHINDLCDDDGFFAAVCL